MYPVEVNYLAVVVSAVVVFALGALWYGSLFTRAWIDAQGYTEEEMGQEREMVKTYTLTFLSYVLMATVVAILVFLVDPPDVARGLWLGSMLWAGLMVPVTLTSVLFSRARFKLFWIDGAYQLVSILIVSAILTGWR